MKNPLRKRYLRELKSDFGKYIAIALFMIMLAGLVSGYLVAAGSIEKTFYEGWDRYNIEDGHITFSRQPDQEVLDRIADEADLTFYDLDYIEEDIDDSGTTLRIYRDRTEVDTECLMEGEMPAAADEIAIDRNFANNNQLEIGDTVELNGKQIRISGIVALVDYNCLYENNNDMMFNSQVFGVGVMTADGFDGLNSDHLYYNYAWKYDVAPADDIEEDSRSEALLDILEDVLQDYDEAQLQAEVDSLYADANELADELTAEFDTVSETVETKITEASEAAAEKAIAGLTDEEKTTLYLQGAEPEEYFAFAAESQGKTEEDLVAEELGTTAEALEAFENAAEDLENDSDSLNLAEEAPKISLDDDEESYENDMDFSLDSLWDVVEKLDATGLYDTARLRELLSGLEDLSGYEFDEDSLLDVDHYIPKYQNKSVTYCMDDMASDKPMFILFDYIVVAILAFVFAVTVSSTIQQEAAVIGTLRASGYKRKELVLHYLFLPVVVTVVASIIGNILGYTAFVEMMKSVFYGSFSLATYESFFNLEALVYTTIVPLLLMFVINLVVLTRKLRLSPISFLRRELTRKKNRKAVRLSEKLPFLTRFRLRILFQNISAYVILSLGIFLGGLIAIFGLMFGPLLDDYADLIVSEKLCDYQYVLMDQVETETPGAEKYCLTSLDSTFEGYLKDEVSIYGIEPDSSYVTENIPEGEVLVSEGILNKFRLAPGDDLTLKDPYSNETYAFRIAGTYAYSASLAVFMNADEYRDVFEEDADYFTGYFSDCEITDLDAKDIATVITDSDLTKVSDQMESSLGEFMSMFKYFGVIMLILLMYLMTKQVIEKNAQSIAMTKILGFRDREISKLYLIMTGIVVLAALLITMPLSDLILRWCFEDFLYKEISGYIPYIVSKTCYVYTFIIGIVCFLVVSVFMFRKIGKIEKSEALKNVE